MHNLPMYKNDLTGSNYPHTVTGYIGLVFIFFTVGPAIDGLTPEGSPPLAIFFVLFALTVILHTVLHNTHYARRLDSRQHELNEKIRNLPPEQRRVVGLKSKDLADLNYEEVRSLTMGIDKMQGLNTALAKENGPAVAALDSINEYLAEQEREVALRKEVQSEMKSRGLTGPVR